MVGGMKMGFDLINEHDSGDRDDRVPVLLLKQILHAELLAHLVNDVEYGRVDHAASVADLLEWEFSACFINQADMVDGNLADAKPVRQETVIEECSDPVDELCKFSLVRPARVE